MRPRAWRDFRLQSKEPFILKGLIHRKQQKDEHH